MSDVERGIPGYAEYAFPPDDSDSTTSWLPQEWEAEFQKTRERLRSFLAARDPYVILARTAVRLMIESTRPSTDQEDRLQQPEAELVQALLLMADSEPKRTPTSPGNFVRFWPLVSQHLRSFIRKQREFEQQSDAGKIVSGRARLQTLYYRNLFTRDDCEQTVGALLGRLDAVSERELGYRLADLFRALVRIVDLVIERLELFGKQIVGLMTSSNRAEVLSAIEFFCTAYPPVERVWRNGSTRFEDIEELRLAGFQLSELAYPWVCTIPRTLLEAEFPSKLVEAIDGLSIVPGSLQGFNPDHIYLNNPVWQRPYVALANGDLFAPLPQLVFSFPFAIIEGLLVGRPTLEAAYEGARADYLEDAIEALLRRAMPSADIYRSAVWTDPATGKNYENDVVAQVGNFIFLFEAKSGQIKDAARRGGELSLTKNFKELFIEPGEQAWRLQNYLDTHRDKAVVRLKSDGSLIDLKLDKPKVVFKFSICIEHFAALTSAKHFLKRLGLIGNDTAWAPVLSLGELQMIDRFLDTEISFVHYLTRRATIEELIDFDGDEQDLLSLYLTNGLWLNAAALDGKKVMFHNADAMVRRPKTPRQSRTEVDVHGVQLSPMWKRIVRELYQDTTQRHRFDIIQVILNQLPPAMAEIERRVRRWRRGEGHSGNDLAVVRFQIGKRLFVIAVHLMKRKPEHDEWREIARNITGGIMLDDGVTESAVFVMVRRSKFATFDGVTFHRLGVRPDPT